MSPLPWRNMTPGKKKKQNQKTQLSWKGGVRATKVQGIPAGGCGAAPSRHALSRGSGCQQRGSAGADTQQLGAVPPPAACASPGKETRQAPSCSEEDTLRCSVCCNSVHELWGELVAARVKSITTSPSRQGWWLCARLQHTGRLWKVMRFNLEIGCRWPPCTNRNRFPGPVVSPGILADNCMAVLPSSCPAQSVSSKLVMSW